MTCSCTAPLECRVNYYSTRLAQSRHSLDITLHMYTNNLYNHVYDIFMYIHVFDTARLLIAR